MMDTTPTKYGQLWSREELVLAFELYCRIPFQRTKASDKRVKELASLLGRTPASVARKLGNFGAFDPELAAKSISGLSHGSKLDRQIWDEFNDDWNSLVVRADQLRHQYDRTATEEEQVASPNGPSERLAITKKRLHQAFFRDAVLSSYNGLCCITGLSITECLIAGHIVPWSVDEVRRADPTNGLCMSATFDRLFEHGFIAVDEDLVIHVSKQLLTSKDRVVTEVVAVHDGDHIIKPVRFLPDHACLRWHMKNVFHN